MSDPVIRLNVALKGRYRIDRELGVCAAEAQLTEPNGHRAVRGEADPGDWEVEDLCLRRIGRAEWMRWGGKRATRALAPADAGEPSCSHAA